MPATSRLRIVWRNSAEGVCVRHVSVRGRFPAQPREPAGAIHDEARKVLAWEDIPVLGYRVKRPNFQISS
jgi:hypothetical protein